MNTFITETMESLKLHAVSLQHSLYFHLHIIFPLLEEQTLTQILAAALILLLLLILLLIIKLGSNVNEKLPDQIKSRITAAKEFVVPPEGPRFRKRDRIAFLGQKMVKRVKAAGSYIRGGQGRKRRALAKFAKRLLGQQTSPEGGGGIRSKLPLPLEYLEEAADGGGQEIMPQQLKFVLQNMRVFGHFEQPIFLEIVKYIEYITVPANQYLFKVREHFSHSVKGLFTCQKLMAFLHCQYPHKISFESLFTSVGDPDPSDPYVFGPPDPSIIKQK
jgi:hypothetical protein